MRHKNEMLNQLPLSPPCSPGSSSLLNPLPAMTHGGQEQGLWAVHASVSLLLLPPCAVSLLQPGLPLCPPATFTLSHNPRHLCGDWEHFHGQLGDGCGAGQAWKEFQVHRSLTGCANTGTGSGIGIRDQGAELGSAPNREKLEQGQ